MFGARSSKAHRFGGRARIGSRQRSWSRHRCSSGSESHPRSPRRQARRPRAERRAEGARRTREDEDADSRGNSFLQQIERTGDVGINKVLLGVCRDMRFMQRCRMDNHACPAHTIPDKTPITDRTNGVGEWRRQHINAADVSSRRPEASNKASPRWPALPVTIVVMLVPASTLPASCNIT